MNIGVDLTITASVIATVALAIIGWVRMRNVAIDKRAEALSARQDRHENRISALEQTTGSLPGRDEMHKIELGIMEMRGDLKQISASMEGHAKVMTRLEAVVSRQEDHLLKGSGR